MQSETIQSCPICNDLGYKNIIIAKDNTVSKENFIIVKCNSCGFLFTNPRPNKNEIGKYYESETYISHTNRKNGILEKVYHLVRNIALKQKVKLIDKYKKGEKKLLDYGCGTGGFLEVCKANGWQISGIEPNDNARKIAEEQTNIKISISKEQENNDKKYSIITLWHVLEHIHDLDETVDWLIEKLDENGRLVIAVPNHKSYDALKYKEHWAAYDLPRHLYHFDQNSIKNLTEKKGLKVIDLIPMYFDSFYVSLLSSKYKEGKMKPISALWTGFVSNIKAMKSKEYSSLIYVIEKNKI